MTVLQTHHALQGFVFLHRLFTLRIPFTRWTLIEHLRLSSGVTSTLKPSLIPPWVIPAKSDVSISSVCSDSLYASLYIRTHTLCHCFVHFSFYTMSSSRTRACLSFCFPPGQSPWWALMPGSNWMESIDQGRKLNQMMKSDYLVSSERTQPL